MSVEKIMVNGHELTAFDLPPEPSETYTVNVDGLGEIVVEKGKPPKEKDMPAMYMRKLVPELCEQNAELYRENAKLREQMERLVTLLRVDCDIDASWDGLRRFWSIELTESGCLIRDRACKAEAENDKLRAERDYLLMNSNPTATELRRVRSAWKKDRDENEKLRELCDDFYKCLDTALYLAKDAGYPVMPDQKLFNSLYPRMRELGVCFGIEQEGGD